uniref:RNA-directed RNA polymerase catalytic subunit n=1 Tax=Cryptocercus meridianus orthomyxovirus 1 TaxID=3133492 RepID=A0AAT9JFP7_9ORTO
MHSMAKRFFVNNFHQIAETVENVMESAISINSDVLTKGKQTWDPINERSVPSPQAYSEMVEMLSKNGSLNHHTLVGLIKCLFESMNKNVFIGTKIFNETKKNVVKKKGKRLNTSKRIIKVRRKQYNGDEPFYYILDLIRSFCGYNKSGERAHLKRRAIASPSIGMRAFLYIVEDFHLKLGKKIEGSTISIGGDEKKMKIIGTMNSAKVDPHSKVILQSTQDATKWNECLSPSGFGMMSMTFFNDEVREELGLRKMNENEKAFGKICLSSHFLLSLKRIYLGSGPQGVSNGIHGEIEVLPHNLDKFNTFNKQWISKLLEYKEDGNYLRASSGMLMGMHNAASTTLGLLSVGYNLPPNSGIYTLRSSDDSMTLYSAPNNIIMANVIDNEDLCLQKCGINLSKKKTFIFKYGYGEYTSWYQDGRMVSQYGPETTTLRPGGNNPPDDFNSLARTTASSLLKLETNDIGAEAKIRIGVLNIRSLYRIKLKYEGRAGIHFRRLLLSDGGANPWNSSNCHLEESCIKEFGDLTCEEEKYFLKVRNPENPFSAEPREEIMWSKDSGTLTMDYVETPRTIFHFIKRTNRAITNINGPTHADDERANSEALKLLTMADVSTLIKVPSGSHTMSSHISSSILLMSSNLNLSEDEKSIVDDALRILKEGKIKSIEEETLNIIDM